VTQCRHRPPSGGVPAPAGAAGPGRGPRTSHGRELGRSGRETRAAATATVLQNPPAAFGPHADPKPVVLLALAIVGLERALHDASLSVKSSDAPVAGGCGLRESKSTGDLGAPATRPSRGSVARGGCLPGGNGASGCACGRRPERAFLPANSTFARPFTRRTRGATFAASPTDTAPRRSSPDQADMQGHGWDSWPRSSIIHTCGRVCG
jgi:hypothetical protein